MLNDSFGSRTVSWVTEGPGVRCSSIPILARRFIGPDAEHALCDLDLVAHREGRCIYDKV